MPERLDLALAPVKDELRAVSERILSQVADPVVRKVVYLIAAGGKRLRPALVLLTGASGPSPNREALIETATAVELIHTATLIHDDIIDQSPLRRSRPTFHQRWGTERAVLMGDYLYATAFTLLARLKVDAPIAVHIHHLHRQRTASNGETKLVIERSIPAPQQHRHVE